MVIVTQNQYILASKIHSVVLNEEGEWKDVHVNGKLVSVKEQVYTIHVTYSPDLTATTMGGNSRDDTRECTCTLKGKVNAYTVYKDLINQLRDQMPDQLFLDKAIENLLNQDSMAKIKTEEEMDVEQEGKQYDAIADAIRGVRKTKRADQKVLRGFKGSNSRSSKRSRR
jgi:hypothetical protein